MSQSCQKAFTIAPSSTATCGSVVAGLGWNGKDNDSNGADGWVGAGGHGTFELQMTDTHAIFSSFVTCVFNTTLDPITIRFRIQASSIGDIGGFQVFDSFTGGFPIFQDWPFTGTLSGDVTIPVGENHCFYIYASVGWTAADGTLISASGILDITCV